MLWRRPNRAVSAHVQGQKLDADKHGRTRKERQPFDPTNHRRANLGYITIAVGRDYRDLTPTSGCFIAPTRAA